MNNAEAPRIGTGEACAAHSNPKPKHDLGATQFKLPHKPYDIPEEAVKSWKLTPTKLKWTMQEAPRMQSHPAHQDDNILEEHRTGSIE